MGEILRWLGLTGTMLRRAVVLRWRRLLARLLKRDELLAGSERKFRALLEAAPDAIVIVDWHGHIKLVNEQAERIFGWPRRDLVGQNLAELIPGRLRGPHREHLKGYLRDAHTRPMGAGLELLARRRDGSEFPVEISLGPLWTREGMFVCSVVRDVTERRLAEAARHEAEERFRTAFQAAPVGMALVSLDGRLLEVNRALCEMLGYASERLAGRELAAILQPDDAAAEYAELRRLVSGQAARHRAEGRYLHADGRTIPVDMSVASVHDKDGHPTHLLVQVSDITERKRFEGQLQYLADHDPLTGTFNRRRFEQELGREHARVARFAGRAAVLAIDLDHFKYINDTLGHSAGDELIARVGRVFRDRLRVTDTLARLGGDEFAVILPGAGRSEAVTIAESLLEALRECVHMPAGAGDAQRRRISGSIGVALLDPDSSGGEEKLVEADIAMYDAKEGGRDCVRVYDSGGDRRQEMQARLEWSDRVKDALALGAFVLHAQPIVALGEDPVPRYELLIRMRGEDGELIPPAAFLYVAERFDLIQRIDRWVLGEAIRVLAERKRAGRPLMLAVNVSAKSVSDPSLPEFVARELERRGIDGRGLCVEVTETAAIVDIERARHFAEELTGLGCEFALDDFGAGFASFYYLKHMRFDYVKIDGEFIRRLTESHVDQLVVKSMIEIARGLGKRTIAEFVEDVAALRLLGEYGVDYAQGFYLGWPAPLAMLRSDDVARLTGTAPVTALSSPRSPRSRPARAAP